MVGTLFLWMYWPSFNCGVFATTEYTKSQIIINTILSLSGSCMATFMTSAFLKDKFTMEHLLNATLAGGVVIGAAAGILYNPGAALAIGILTGVVSTLCFHSLTHQMELKLGIYDTCGVNNLHGIPGIIGGILSGVAAAAYSQPDIYDKAVTTGANGKFPDLEKLVNHPYWQGGMQIAATFVSAGIGIFFGIIAGLILKKISTLEANEMYSDKYYFEDAVDESQHLYG
jgi:ammonium transporter Rh